MRRLSIFVLAGWLCAWLATPAARADKLDDFTIAVMKKRHIPGLSLAIIEDGKIARAQGYGFADRDGKVPVISATLFQAGSISKPVAAVGALHLVQSGQLALDTNVNQLLKGWKVPENEFTKEQKVTVRRILSHNAGLTVHGFPGYANGQPIPTLVQVLDGEQPANTKPIRVDIVPGSELRYSGGGYTVLQQLVIDTTGKTFPNFMEQVVLKPVGMLDSTFEQPPPKALASRTATGYYASGLAVEGRWHVYPEMAAAGLWTTPSDLARFAIGLEESAAGKNNPVIPRELTRDMLTPQLESAGLGIFLEGKGKGLRFLHSGRDEGFDAEMVGYVETGQGAVVMINANDNSGAIRRVMEAIARQYHWVDYH